MYSMKVRCHNGRYMKLSQLRAIGYADRRRQEERRELIVVEKEGSLDAFRKSGYKTLRGYINKREAEQWL